MKRKFLVEIETESEACFTTANDIHLALVKYFVSGVYIRVAETKQPATDGTHWICSNCNWVNHQKARFYKRKDDYGND